MSTDFELEISPGGSSGGLSFFLTASDPSLGLDRKQFLRNALNLSVDDIKDLRSGSPSALSVMRIATQVSNWVIDPEMTNLLNTPVNGSAPIRIIFKVERALLNTLADLPFELLRINDQWLVMRPSVSAIVHQLPLTGTPKSPNQSLPLKVLVVRSSPSSLGVKVPPAGPICNQIIKLANELGPNLVQLDLLSREVGSLEPNKTWDEFEASQLPDLVIKPDDSAEERKRKDDLKWREFREYLLDKKITDLAPGTWDLCVDRLRKTDYHILVYLGHGNHLDVNHLNRKTGVLQFEKAGGKNSDTVTSSELNEALQARRTPVPVVLLAGCLTAAEFDTETAVQWALGSQGVAQALVDSATGVQCAVGMRYQIEIHSAFDFLKSFFTSLLGEAPGNVEAAVRSGRSAMFIQGEFPPSWSAPVIFRTKGEEPMFRFIGEVPKSYELDRDDSKAQDIREAMWSGLLQEPNSQLAHTVLQQTEEAIMNKAKGQGISLVMPEMKEAARGETLPVRISLYGNLTVDLMKCKLVVSGEGGSIQSIRSTQALKESGFRLTDIGESGDREISFSIRRVAQANPLPEGAIIETQLTFGTTGPAKYTVNLDVLETQPKQVVRPVNNVVLIRSA